MLALPSLTMPSSRDHDSCRASWKYRSAKSTECVSTSPKMRSRRPSSSPLGFRMRSRASDRGSEAKEVGSVTIELRRMSMMGLSVEYSVCQRREAVAVAPLPLEVDLRGDAAAAPVIDDHAVAVGFAPARMEARLRGRDQPAQVL